MYHMFFPELIDLFILEKHVHMCVCPSVIHIKILLFDTELLNRALVLLLTCKVSLRSPLYE
jgi:hypothetical protein